MSGHCVGDRTFPARGAGKTGQFEKELREPLA